MNKDEKKMIEDMRAIIQREHSDCMSNLCENCEYYAMNYCGSVKKANALHNAGCRIIGDDEIVVKKSEYDILLKDYTITYGNAYQWGLKVGEEKTARDIFEDIEYYGVRSLNDKVWGNHFKLTDYTILDLKIKYGIAKAYGIELGD